MKTDLVCNGCHGRVVRQRIDGEIVLSCICKVLYVQRGRGQQKVDEWVDVDEETGKRQASPVTA